MDVESSEQELKLQLRLAQIKKNEERIEQIVVKLIDNSKKERESNRANFEAILNRMDALVDILVKLSGNGLKK